MEVSGTIFSAGRDCVFSFFHLKVFLFPGLLGLVSISFLILIYFLMPSQLLPSRFNLFSPSIPHFFVLFFPGTFPRASTIEESKDPVLRRRRRRVEKLRNGVGNPDYYSVVR